MFTARKTDGTFVIVKIYRLEACNFNKMHEYIRQDPRYIGMAKSRRKTIFSWVQREYRNLLKAREAIRVPTPMAQKDHVLVMELIGHDDCVSPMVKDLPPEHPEQFLDAIIDAIRRLWRDAGIVHGDLSAYNVLNHDEQPVIIDFSQATTTETHGAKELLERDVRNVCAHFAKLGVKKDVEGVVKGVLLR